jgi:hypothetical protein
MDMEGFTNNNNNLNNLNGYLPKALQDEKQTNKNGINIDHV